MGSLIRSHLIKQKQHLNKDRKDETDPAMQQNGKGNSEILLNMGFII